MARENRVNSFYRHLSNIQNPESQTCPSLTFITSVLRAVLGIQWHWLMIASPWQAGAQRPSSYLHSSCAENLERCTALRDLQIHSNGHWHTATPTLLVESVVPQLALWHFHCVICWWQECGMILTVQPLKKNFNQKAPSGDCSSLPYRGRVYGH